MNTSNNLTALSIVELINQKKKISGILIGLGIVMALAAVLLFYVAITRHKPAFLAIAISFPLTLLPILIRLAQINKELKSRNQL